MELGQESDWVPVDGGWTYASPYNTYGWRNSMSGAGSDTIKKVIAGSAAGGAAQWKDYAVRSKFKPSFQSGQMKKGAKFGLIIRYQDNNNYYYGAYDRSSDSISITKVRNGVATPLGTPRPMSAANWNSGTKIDDTNQAWKNNYLMGMEARGNIITFYVDYNQWYGTPLRVSVTDSTNPIPAGRPGIMTAGNTDGTVLNPFFEGLMTAPVFRDDFANSNAWDTSVTSPSNWGVSNGYGNTGGTVNWQISAAGESGYGDINYFSRVMPDGDFGNSSGRRVALITHLQNANNHYRYELCDDNKLRFVKVVGGTATEIASVNYTFTKGVVYAVNIHIDRNLFKVYIDGALVMEEYSYEPALVRGRIGVARLNCGVRFRNIRVNAMLMN